MSWYHEGITRNRHGLTIPSGPEQRPAKKETFGKLDLVQEIRQALARVDAANKQAKALKKEKQGIDKAEAAFQKAKAKNRKVDRERKWRDKRGRVIEDGFRGRYNQLVELLKENVLAAERRWQELKEKRDNRIVREAMQQLGEWYGEFAGSIDRLTEKLETEYGRRAMNGTDLEIADEQEEKVDPEYRTPGDFDQRSDLGLAQAPKQKRPDAPALSEAHKIVLEADQGLWEIIGRISERARKVRERIEVLRQNEKAWHEMRRRIATGHI